MELKKKKPKKLSYYKKKLDKLYSEYIRRKDADKEGFNFCYTCGARHHWKKLQNGHYVRRSAGLSVYFLEENCRPQCLTGESNLQLYQNHFFKGGTKNIKDIVVGDKLWAFDKKSFEHRGAFVECKREFIPEELYEVELENGDKFFATGDHKVVANDKWVKIEDMLQDFTTYDILEL